MQDALARLHDYWAARGCMTVQPFNTEVGAGTMNPATLLRVLGPEPWNVAYVEPSVRPDDSRYGENPQRLQTFTQFQVILKPEPGDPQELYLDSLKALGIDLDAHDVRFVEDNWAQPAIGAWGLGWEVWLDGMEITQFTYFQQVGGQNLDPVPVELTYGIERIMMALQGVTHFKDIQYAPGVTYGEAFGQSEYEMSRYYLDEADVAANQALYDTYVAEAQRMVDAGLPVPAHSYVLKSSHAFNVLDARGAISTTERANAFGTMRRLARDVARLWVERREELGFPLRKDAAEAEAPAAAADGVPAPTGPADLTVEIGVEELPPHVQPQAVAQVRDTLTAALASTRLEHGAITVDGTPRRIVAHVEDVAALEPDAEKLAKGPKVAAAFDAEGNPTKALQGFARGQGIDPADVERVEIEGAEHVAVRRAEPGRPAAQILPGVVEAMVKGLRADKNMRWNDPELSYSRAIRWIVALHGDAVVPARVGGLTAGRTTYTLRGDEDPRPQVRNGDELAGTLRDRGILVSTAERRQEIVDGAQRLAEAEGGSIDVEGEAAVIDEITGLVEAPHPLVVRFDERYLELPEQILTSVMRKHQRYLPVRDAQGGLKPCVVAVANGDCDDEVVAAGNATVLRARYEDALFFYNADLQVPLEQHKAGLEKLTFENRLGSVAQRADRIRDVAAALAERVALTEHEQEVLTRAGELAKFDLASQMVVEMSSLAGFMAHEYATRAGEPEAVATALAEMERPRTSSDPLPGTMPGALLALADRLDLVAAMFALGAKPTGSSDPFGLRRACLGIVRILTDLKGVGGGLVELSLREALGVAGDRLRRQGVEVSDESLDAAAEFAVGRYEVLLREQGVSPDLSGAILPAAPTPGYAAATLGEAADLRDDETFRAIVAAVQRITRIVPEDTEPMLDDEHLTEPAEKDLLAVVRQATPAADLTAMVSNLGQLVTPIATFFDETLVMAEEPAVRAARLGLLAHVRALAPRGIDWVGLHTWLGA